MHMPNCDLCDRPASIFETAMRGRVVKVRRLCRAHGLKLWRDAIVPATEQLSKRSPHRSDESAIAIPATDSRPHGKR